MSLAFRDFKRLVIDNDGFVNPALRLLIGEQAGHGLISLSGVCSDELSLIIPRSLAETKDCPGLWMRFLESLGYDVFGEEFYRHHSFTDGFMPLIGAANHNSVGGNLVETQMDLRLYGIDFCYSADPAHLERMWSICE